MGRVLHRCRFIEWQPENISVMDMSPLGTLPLLAVVRGGGDMEIFDASRNWMVTRRIPTGGKVGKAISSVLWLYPSSGEKIIKDFDMTVDYKVDKSIVLSKEMTSAMPMGCLFTIGYDGMLIEWDLNKCLPKRYLEVGGGSLWCMTKSMDEQYLAIACQNGTVKVIDVKRFKVIKTLVASQLDPESNKLLSITWCPLGKFIAVGTLGGTVLVWDFETSQLIQTIEMETARQHPTSMVWCVAFVGSTLVSGNSIGQVQFWNPKLGTLMSTFKMPNANILTLAVHPSQRRVFASASDGRTLDLYAADDKNNNQNPHQSSLQWKSLERMTIHSHDISTSTCAFIPTISKDGKGFGFCSVFISGGLGTEIAILKIDADEKNRIRYISPLTHHHGEIIKFASKARIIAASTEESIKLWTTGSIANTMSKDENDDSTDLAFPNKCLLKMNLPYKESILSFDISSNARLLAYSTRASLRLYNLDITANDNDVTDIAINKIKIEKSLLGKNSIVQQVAFKSEKELLLVVLDGKDCNLISWIIDDVSMTIQSNFVISLDKDLSIRKLLINPQNDTCILLDTKDNIIVVDLKSKQIIKKDLSLSYFINELAIIPNDPRNRIVAITDNKQIYVIDPVRDEIKAIDNLPSSWYNSNEIIKGLVFPPNSPNDLKLWSESMVVECELYKNNNNNQADAVSDSSKEMMEVDKQSSVADQDGSCNFNDRLVIHGEYSRILHFEYVNESEILLVERPWESIESALPKAQDRKEYGGY